MRWTSIILLASVTFALAKEERPRRDLAFIKNLITSRIFGACDTHEVKESAKVGVKFYKIHGFNDILIKATPNLTKDPVLITIPRPVLTQGVQETVEVVPRPFVEVTDYVPAPIEVKYSYEQQRSNGYTTTYTSRNGGDVKVTERKTMPPLPPYITRRFQDVIGGVNPTRSAFRIPSSRPVLNEVMQPLPQNPGYQEVFHPILTNEAWHKTPTGVYAQSVHPSINAHQIIRNRYPYEFIVSPPTSPDYRQNVYSEIYHPRYHNVYPSFIKNEITPNVKPSTGRNNYSYKVVHKDNSTTTYLGSETDTKDNNIHPVKTEMNNTLPSPPAFITDRILKIAHPVEPLHSDIALKNDHVRVNLLPDSINRGLNTKIPNNFVYIPPVSVNAGIASNTPTVKNYSIVPNNSYKQVIKMDEPAKVLNASNTLGNVKSTNNATWTGRLQNDDVEHSWTNKPIVVPDTKYLYKQYNNDGSSISMEGNSDNTVSVILIDKKPTPTKKGRGDIP